MKKINHFLQSILVFLAIIFSASLATAPAAYACNTGNTFTLLPAWHDGIDCGPNGGVVGPEKGQIGPYLTKIVLNIIEMLLYIVGYVSLGFIIWGGFKFMINGDNSGGVAAAKKTVLNAAIGLVISIFAVAIINLIAGAFGQ